MKEMRSSHESDQGKVEHQQIRVNLTEKGTEDITVRQNKTIRSELQSCVEETLQSRDINYMN